MHGVVIFDGVTTVGNQVREVAFPLIAKFWPPFAHRQNLWKTGRLVDGRIRHTLLGGIIVLLEHETPKLRKPMNLVTIPKATRFSRFVWPRRARKTWVARKRWVAPNQFVGGT
jgi:hypothetical protein